MSKGSPIVNVRVTPAVRDTLKQVSSVYGSPNTSAFLRDMIHAMCSDDAEKVHVFMARLFTRLGERKQLELTLGTKGKRTRRHARP